MNCSLATLPGTTSMRSPKSGLQAGVVAAGATAATQAVSPQFKPIPSAVAVGATVIGVGADVVEQVVRPDLGQTVVN